MSSRTSATTAVPENSAPGRKGRVIVLDDEQGMQRLLKLILESEGYEVRGTDDGRLALEWAAEGCDLVVQDLRMPKMDGLTFLKLLKEKHPGILSIVVTAFGTWETSVEAMRLGAYSHLSKPFDTEEIRQLVARALERKRITERSPASDDRDALEMVGHSSSMNAVAGLIKRIAPTDSTVLITGESGTGKELVARAIHDHSLRMKGPFVPVNCGAFTETLLESELFGHVKGAFTHAIADRKGLFDSADLGTLFLDEIGEMSPLMQVKLLRVLETRAFKPVGGNRELKADVRIIAATNRHLGQMVTEGNFREDLFHRLNVIPIALPPLRERREDVPMLAGHFLARYSKRMGKQVSGIDEGALRKLIEYHWPGNVRELENTIERAVALCPKERIEESDVVGPMSIASSSGRTSAQALVAGAFAPSPSSMAGHAAAPAAGAAYSASAGQASPPHSGGPAPALPASGFDLERHLIEQERAYIIQALERTDWNLTEAAKLLGMTFRSIRYRVSKLGIERPAK
ncbi:MAG: sigma-54-dependent Fis family transcriptional regulator [Planctomycetes bacterium]|nr:sigma-54-dependent Fis family transcriptional regulator [Planctomycetota bacterium]